MRRSNWRVVLWVAGLAGLGVTGTAGYVYSGVYDVSALKQHTPLVYWAVTTARRQSVRLHSAATEPPSNLLEPGTVAAGLAVYEGHCQQCHGAPGVPPGEVALGMSPPPPSFAQMGAELTPAQIHWSVTNGIKMTGMPAWKYRLGEDERWAVTAFLASSWKLTPASYEARRKELAAAAAAPSGRPGLPAEETSRASANRGLIAAQQYACPTCHVIPGIRGDDARVGPRLDQMPHQTYIAGVALNTPGNMVAWLRDPPGLKPGTAMPKLGLTERDAADIAAYLYAQR